MGAITQMETVSYLIKFMEILNIGRNCASTQMASILSICDCTRMYKVFLSSLVKLVFNKITFIVIRIFLMLWYTTYGPPCLT